MKLIIDIDEKEYIGICEEPCTKLGLAIANGTLLEAQPTDEIKEAYLKGYDYGVKDWFKSKTQPTHGSTYGGVSWGGIYKEEAQPTEAVSREAVEEITFQEPSYTDPYNILTEVREKVRALPPVTPERPKGKWIEYEVDVAPHPLHCSLCGFSNHHISNRYMREFRRCPNCGAEMEVEE